MTRLAVFVLTTWFIVFNAFIFYGLQLSVRIDRKLSDIERVLGIVP